MSFRDIPHYGIFPLRVRVLSFAQDYRHSVAVTNLINDRIGSNKSRDAAPGRLRINALEQLTRFFAACGMDNTNLRGVAYAGEDCIFMAAKPDYE
jgi:hypothetical protein